VVGHTAALEKLRYQHAAPFLCQSHIAPAPGVFIAKRVYCIFSLTSQG